MVSMSSHTAASQFDNRIITTIKNAAAILDIISIDLNKSGKFVRELRKTDKEPELAATVYEPVSGRFMEVWTTEPGLQFYGGNFFDGTIIGKSGKPYNYRSSFVLETQHFPDSPNKPQFPSTVLNPGETYHQVCKYVFDIKK